MVNKTPTSWLSMVKRALGSNAKDNEKKSCRTREKRRWLFKWSQQRKPKTKSQSIAAVNIVRLNCRASNYAIVGEKNQAAIVIQTAFRGYIARKTFGALKGVVKLQALVALKCMQSLVRVQNPVLLHQQRARLSYEGCRTAMFIESNSSWESPCLQDVRRRKSITLDKDEKEVEEATKWLDRRRATKQWESHNRASIDKRDSIREPLQLRLASLRCLKEKSSYHSAANSPRLTMVPNYMAATESAKAKVRSQSTPRQRPGNAERAGGGKISPRSTSDLRWMKL
ncbi:hypothetical protein ES332_D11G018800v1 [Gossypium tomentosum]|uniref:DUF4005 domain-containing protein n=1 Tax=Gossypium tomentosum TaxID=34277 RepID=A0A5D2IHI0_GOSTO|nr:hypothetical protein ES332_D11G018800v1 [Gossypium tomentosum]